MSPVQCSEKKNFLKHESKSIAN